MDKRIIYGVGGVALVGIAYYLYSKSKNDTRSGTDITPPDMSMSDATMGSVVAVRPSTPSGAGAVNNYPIMDFSNPTPVEIVTTPSGGTTATIGSGSGAYSLNPNNPSTQVVIDKVTTGTTPSTSDVTAFVDPSSYSLPPRTTTPVDPSSYSLPQTTPPTTTKDTTPIVTRGFDGGFSYADGRRFRSRRNSLRGF